MEWLIPIVLFVCIVVAIHIIMDGRVRRRIAESGASEDLVRTMLAAWRDAVGDVDWTAAALEEATRGFAGTRGVKLGAVAQPIRAAVTGSTASPPLFDVLAALGREETFARLDAA